MRPAPDPLELTPDERAGEMLDAFDLEEMVMCGHLRYENTRPWHHLEGIAAGRLRRTNGGIRKTHARLTFRCARIMLRPGSKTRVPGWCLPYVALRSAATGEVVRLPYC